MGRRSVVKYRSNYSYICSHMKKIISISIIALIIVCGFVAKDASAGTLDLTGWAWSSNVGWFSFNSVNTNAGYIYPKPVARYTFDNDTAADTSGSSVTPYNGTLVGTPSFASDTARGRVLRFDGINDKVNLPEINPTRVTISAWIKTDAVGTQQRIVNYNYRYGLEIVNSKLRCLFGVTSPVWAACTTPGSTVLLSNTWYHVAVTYDGVSKYTYYVNGVPDGSNSTQFTGNLIGHQQVPCIGHICVDTISTLYFKGSMDDVRIYDYALSAQEIQQIYTTYAGSVGSYKVTVSTTTGSAIGAFGGYAWSPNVGWLSFDPLDVSGCPTSESTYDTPGTQPGFGASLPTGNTNICAPRVDISNGKVSGWGRILSMKAEDPTSGWLHLSGTNHRTGFGGVTYNINNGAFTGYAWEPSALGWVDFTAGSPITTGVVICRPGPGCPPLPGGSSITGTCTIKGSSSSSITIDAGTEVEFRLSGVVGGTGSRTYTWYPLGAGNSGAASDITYQFMYSDTGSSVTYTPAVVIRDSNSSTGTVSCPSVNVRSANTGMKLMIFPASQDISSLRSDDYTDSASGPGKRLTVRKGDDFKLKWNIRTGVGIRYFKLGDTGNSNWETHKLRINTSAVSANFDTSNVPVGSYTFTLTYSDDNPSGPYYEGSKATLVVTDVVLEEI